VVDFVRHLLRDATVDDRIWIEQRVALTDQIWGRCDVSHWHDLTRTLTIVDYKDGYIGVDPDASQLRIYGASSMFTHKLPVKWFRFVVVQPNDFRPVPRVKQIIEPVETLYEWAEKIAAIPKGPKQFVAGEHCRYCPLFGKCEASQDLLKQLAVMLQSTPGEVRADQIALFLHLRKPIDDWFKSLEKVGTKRALAGNVPPAMGLFTVIKHRSWLDENAARVAVIEKLGIDKLKPPTPAQAEEMGLDISTLADRPEGGPVLGFAGDKRKPWAPKSATEMFGNLVGAA
jgi:hypothetical protein